MVALIRTTWGTPEGIAIWNRLGHGERGSATTAQQTGFIVVAHILAKIAFNKMMEGSGRILDHEAETICRASFYGRMIQEVQCAIREKIVWEHMKVRNEIMRRLGGEVEDEPMPTPPCLWGAIDDMAEGRSLRADQD